MALAQVVGQVLEHVDVERWERPAQLLRLIATLQEGPNPVPLGRALLEATGRTNRQARYDHEVLVRMAERDRILMRWRGDGRRPDSWAVAPLEKWRHVPWITPRRDVLDAFLSPLPDEAVALWTKRAAQAVELRTSKADVALLEALQTAGLSVNLRASTPRHMATTPRLPGETKAGYGHNATAIDGAFPYGSESEFTPSLPPSEAKEGGRECRDTDDPGEKLLAAVAAAVATPVLGTNRDRIRSVGRAHASRLDDLIRFCSTLEWVRTGNGAATAVEERARALAVARSASPEALQAVIDGCGRCDERGFIELPDDTVMRCDHVPHDPADGAGFGGSAIREAVSDPA